MKPRWFGVTLAGLVAVNLAACTQNGSTAVQTQTAISQPAATAAVAGAAPTAAANGTDLLGNTAGISSTTSTTTTNLLSGISGIGEITALQDSDLSFQTQGIVTEVRVKEGDTVKQGDVLAVLDARSLDQQIQQAQASLQSAQAQASSLREPPRSADVAAARAQIQSAQAALSQVQAGPKEEDIRTSQASIDSAQASLQGTRDKLSLAKTQAEGQVDQLTQTLTQAQAAYAKAKSNWDYVQETGRDPITPDTVNVQTGKKTGNKLSDGGRQNYYTTFVQSEATLHQAEQNVDLAVKSAETARQNEITGIQTAEQQVIQAQQALNKLTLAPDQDKVAQAQAAVSQAQAQASKLNPAPNASQREIAAAGIAQAEAALELAKINRDRAELKAPFDGVVAAVNVDPGDPTSATQGAVRLVDASKLRAEVQISDTDIAKVQLNQQAQVRTDAVPDKTFTGRVSYIAPAATIAGNIRSYLVRVDLDDQSNLRAGMSARVSINAE